MTQLPWRLVMAGLVCAILSVPFAAPNITSLSPTSGAVGAPIMITGTNFGSPQSTGTVSFNGTTATTITKWTAKSIMAIVPTGATTGNVVVNVSGVTSNGVIFTVPIASFILIKESLATARLEQTATLLNNGKVLVVGGVGGWQGPPIPSAELYDPTSATFSNVGNLNSARRNTTATLLTNGLVLIAGGSDSNFNQVARAELYNPTSGTFAFTGSLNTPRSGHAATLLRNGQVLILGGWDSNGDTVTSSTSSSELYNPATGTFTASGSLNTARSTTTATLLDNGKVLIVGGYDVNGNALASAELYNPASGTFKLTGSLNVGRAANTATMLNNGLVLIAGGEDDNYNVLASAELYNPATGIFTLTGSMNTPRFNGGMGTLLNNGRVLFAGGSDNAGNPLASTELYDPSTGSFTASATMNTARRSQTTTRLNNGQVFVSAGICSVNDTVLSSTELYEPKTLTPPGLVSIIISPNAPSISVGGTELFTATGTFSDNRTEKLVSANWSSSDTTIVTIANDATNDGTALAVGTGSATLSACTGSICGSTTLTVLPGTQPPTIMKSLPISGPISGADGKPPPAHTKQGGVVGGCRKR